MAPTCNSYMQYLRTSHITLPQYAKSLFQHPAFLFRGFRDQQDPYSYLKITRRQLNTKCVVPFSSFLLIIYCLASMLYMTVYIEMTTAVIMACSVCKSRACDIKWCSAHLLCTSFSGHMQFLRHIVYRNELHACVWCFNTYKAPELKSG